MNTEGPRMNMEFITSGKEEYEIMAKLLGHGVDIALNDESDLLLKIDLLQEALELLRERARKNARDGYE